MPLKKNRYEVQQLRFVSSGSKLWNQVIIFILLGILPIIFPDSISVPNQKTLFINLFLTLLTSIFYEFLFKYLRSKNKSTKKLMVVQIMTSVVLLTWFLFSFTRINGPLFILYLLTVMESALNLNTKLPNIVVGIMLATTTIEFIYLLAIEEIVLNLTHFIEFMIRIAALIFMRTYGLAFAQKIISEKRSRQKTQKTARELRKTSIKLQKTNLRLKELSSMKDEFVSIASHELRTPMTAIKSYLWLALNKHKKELSAKLTKNLNRAYVSTERTITLVKDMLTISRIEGRRLDLNFVKLDLASLAKQIFDELKIKTDEKQIKFSFHKPKFKCLVKADEHKVTEVLQNVIGNAIKFTPLKGSITISFQKENGKIETSVKDTGPGIPKRSMPNLFKKFGRLGGTFAKLAETPGTGLGLYIAKQIITLHKGRIWVQSKVGEGSTFIFSLPKYNNV